MIDPSEIQWRLDAAQKRGIALDARQARLYRLMAVWLRAGAVVQGEPDAIQAGAVYDGCADEIERRLAEKAEAA